MRYEKEIGKKVWLLDGSRERGFELNSTETYTLKEVKSGKDCGTPWENRLSQILSMERSLSTNTSSAMTTDNIICIMVAGDIAMWCVCRMTC